MDIEQAIENLLGIRVDVVSDCPRTAHALTEAKAEAVGLHELTEYAQQAHVPSA